MEILFVTGELAPYSCATAAADACAGLAKALRALEHRVVVVSPLYASIDPAAHSLARRLTKLALPVGSGTVECEIYDGRTSGGIDLVFVGHEELLSERRQAPSDQALGGALALSRAALEIARTRESPVEIVHAHDWLSAPAVVLAREALPEARTVLTLYEPGETGRFDREQIERLAPGTALAGDGGTREQSLIARAVQHADQVITVSTSDAEAIASGNEPWQLGAHAPAAKRAPIGIAGGLDAAMWNPLIDMHIKAHFDPVDLTGKARCKGELQSALELPIRPEVPLIVLAEDLAAGSPLARKAGALRRVARNDVQLLLLDTGDGEVAAELEELDERLDDRVAIEACEEELLHRAIAASDIFVVADADRSPALLHLCAQRYGSLPVVPRAGVWVDTVVDSDEQLTTGSGFCFEPDGSDELAAAVQRAVAAYAKGEPFDVLRRRVMRIENSWERAARRYEHVYRHLGE